MNVAELFVKCLENEGVEYVFGVPGEENEDFLFAIQDSGIQFVPVRQEQGGAFIANLYGRLTGKAGVCLSTLGPGATNMLTGVADAYLDKAPVVAITGQGGISRLHHESHQMIDVKAMYKSVSKWNTSIASPVIVAEVVRKAFKIAKAEKPGATHIELPEDVAKLEVENEAPLQKRELRRPAADQKAIDQAVELLTAAEKPIIIAGNGAIRNRASQALTNFARKFNIPVASTFMGKGAISDREKQSLGTIGLGFKDYVVEAFEKADVVLSIGYDIAEYDPENWNANKEKRIIHLDFEWAEVFTNYIPEVEIVGDLANSIKSIASKFQHDPWPNWFSDIRQRIKESVQQHEMKELDTDFNVPKVVGLVREVLADDGLLISDVGSHKMWIARNFPTYVPNGCIISNGLATMGIALPGGIGAKIVDPKRQVVALMGDGGALMNFQELETAHRLGVGYAIVICNDNNYGLIEWKQERNESKSFGTRLGNPDFKKLAESFGIAGYRPRNAEEFQQQLGSVLENNELAVFELEVSTKVNDELINELNEYFKK